MIKNITSLNPNEELLTIDIEDLDGPSGFMVVSIDGLGSPTANINTSGGPNHDVVTVNSTKANKRTIGLTIAILGGGVQEEVLRRSLYRHFPIKNKILFGVVTDSRSMVIDAYVEDNAVNMFVQQEHTVISLICPRVYFRDVIEQVITFSGTVPNFEFPFSNESLTERLLYFGTELDYVYRDIDYIGDIETGLSFTLHAIGPVEYIGIYNPKHKQSMSIDTVIVTAVVGSPIQLGDDIIINTRVGQKSIILIRSGITYNIFNALTRHPNWISLLPGENSIAYGALVGVDNLEMPMTYDIMYEGL